MKKNQLKTSQYIYVYYYAEAAHPCICISLHKTQNATVATMLKELKLSKHFLPWATDVSTKCFQDTLFDNIVASVNMIFSQNKAILHLFIIASV